MKNILLPTDFSDISLNAINYTIELFKDEKCKFFVLHTYTPIIYDPEILILEKVDFVLEFVEKKLENLITDLKKIAGIDHSFEQIASFSVLTTTINEIIEEKEIYMVVMGTKGATGAREILWGSNTVHVLKKIRCPLLMIPENSSYKKPNRILFPTDFNFNYPLTVLNVVKDLCKKNDSKLHILHMSKIQKTNYDITNNKKLLVNELKSIRYSFHTTFGQFLADAILEFENELNIDLLVMVNNKRSFFKNILFSSAVKRIGFRNKKPFLVLPTPK